MDDLSPPVLSCRQIRRMENYLVVFFFCSESAIESGEEHYHTGSMYFSWVMSSVGYAQTTESSAKGEIRTKLHMFLVYDI